MSNRKERKEQKVRRRHPLHIIVDEAMFCHPIISRPDLVDFASKT